MLTGEIRSQINAIWDSFWSGGISNPLEVMEQITYLLFIRRLDDAHTLEESKALLLKRSIEHRVFPAGKDAKSRPYDDLRWSRFKNFSPSEMHAVVGEHVFPFLRTMGDDGSTYAHHMKDARFTIPTASLLAKVMDMLDKVPMEVGLDREAAMQAFSELVAGSTLTPHQIEFIDLVVQELTQNSVMDADRLFQSPFTDLNAQGPLGIFPPAKVTAMVQVLEGIRSRAVA